MTLARIAIEIGTGWVLPSYAVSQVYTHGANRVLAGVNNDKANPSESEESSSLLGELKKSSSKSYTKNLVESLESSNFFFKAARILYTISNIFNAVIIGLGFLSVLAGRTLYPLVFIPFELFSFIVISRASDTIQKTNSLIDEFCKAKKEANYQATGVFSEDTRARFANDVFDIKKKMEREMPFINCFV